MSQIWEQNIIFWCNSVCNFILASKSYNLVLLTSLWTLFQNERILQMNLKKIKMRKLGRCIPSTQSTVYLTQVLVLLCLHQTLVALLCEHWNKSLIQIYCKVLEWLLLRADGLFSPLALDGAELVTLGEAEWLELRLEVDGLGWKEKKKCEKDRKESTDFFVVCL